MATISAGALITAMSRRLAASKNAGRAQRQHRPAARPRRCRSQSPAASMRLPQRQSPESIPQWRPRGSSCPRSGRCRITATRSLMPRISGQFGRDHHDRQTALRQIAHDAVAFRLRAHIDTLRRLIEDQHLRLRRDPAGDRDLLLIAAGKRATGASMPSVFTPSAPPNLSASVAFRAEAAADRPSIRDRRIASVALARTGSSPTTPCCRRSSGT